MQEVGVGVILVCSRRICGPSPLHGTIVNNVETDCSKQAFNTRVSEIFKKILQQKVTQLSASSQSVVISQSVSQLVIIPLET